MPPALDEDSPEQGAQQGGNSPTKGNFSVSGEEFRSQTGSSHTWNINLFIVSEFPGWYSVAGTGFLLQQPSRL